MMRLACFLMVMVFAGSSFCQAGPPKNVIIFIGDGMGPEEVKAAGMYAHGSAGTLSFESLPYQAQVTTYSANASITDSAAAATAIATSHKVNNGVISLAIPGDTSELQTLLEYFKVRGKRTGLVTTTFIAHATPAAFGAHETNRHHFAGIVNDYLNQTKPNVLFGGNKYINAVAATAAGYTVVTNRASMNAVDPNSVNFVSGQFWVGDHMPYEYDQMPSQPHVPHLSEMTAVALDILDNDPNGFFLMVEGGRIDHAGHINHLQRNVMETIEFSKTVQVGLNWVSGRRDTLIIVTADHETGGLTVLQNNGQGVFPTVSWTTTHHTGVNIGAFATGVNAPLVRGVLNNTDFFAMATLNEIGFSDLEGGYDVDLFDFSLFALGWDKIGCVFPDYCNGADLDLSGTVGLNDLTVFSSHFITL